ncbi:YcaO-like family protein [Actinoplanes sp. HUAS TT8]|uniref:YcaO-like family protein n=1 Tax=Actinoplanes sp. HUAS TT8 TaxID=3447453 RepID=UPI003F528E6B
MTEDTMLAVALRAALGSRLNAQVCTGDPAVFERGRPAVIVLPDWTPRSLARLGDRAVAAGTTLVTVRHDGAVTLLGPVMGPGLDGCLACAEDARRAALDLPGEPAGLTFGGAPAPVSTPVIVELIVEALRAPAAAARTMWMVRAGDATVSVHRPGHGPHCAAGGPPPDEAAGAGFRPRPRPVPGPELRQPNPRTGVDRLRAALVDRVLGPVVALDPIDGMPLPLATATILAGAGRESGHGRGVTPDQAERVALLEAVERRLAMRPHRRRTVLRAAFDELGPDRALDPAATGLPDPVYDHHPASLVTPYRPELPTTWVHGWSMTRRQTLAVPEHMAYYGIAATPAAPHFVDPNSNGCGLGNSLEEAILYGLCEVLERDAFLMAWYATTPLPRVAVPAGDPITPHLLDRLDELDYELRFFSATNDLALPVVIALATQRDPDSPAPHAYFAAAAHPDPRAAIRAAAVEIAVGVYAAAGLTGRHPRRLGRERALRMLADPAEVRDIDDHVALHAVPEARTRYEFLLHDEQPRPWTRVWPGAGDPGRDVTDVLTGVVDRLAAEGLDTVVVDQTDPGLRDRLGLHAARVIVPGTLPMTFGHVHRRTRGLPRLLEVPHRLGRAPAVLDHDRLALHPHPFP